MPPARHSLLVLLVAFACATVYFSLWLTPLGVGPESASAPLGGKEVEKGEGEGEGKEKRHAIVGLMEEGERRSVPRPRLLDRHPGVGGGLMRLESWGRKVEGGLRAPELDS